MGDRNAITERSFRRRGHSNSGDHFVARSNDDNNVDVQYYMDRMREILTGFPNTGPPAHPAQVLDHVYMGNQRNADNVELLRRFGITHVLNCAGLRRYDFSRSPYPKESGIKGFLMISAEDSEDYDIAEHFDEAIAFLDRVKKTKGKALVHCNLGVNRSGAVVAAYLMAEQRRTLLEVVNYLKVKRFVVLSNKGFRRQLIQFARNRGLLDPIIRCPTDVAKGDEDQDHLYPASKQLSARDRGGGGGDGGSGGNEGRVEGRGDVKQEPLLRASTKMSAGVSKNLTSSGVSSSDRSNNGLVAPVVDLIDTMKGPSLGGSRCLTNEDPRPRVERLWTLPRSGTTHSGSVGPSHISVEVTVSQPTDSDCPLPGGQEFVDSKSKSKIPQSLSPVYETRSCEAGIGSSSSSGSGSRVLTSAAESMSAKLTGFLNLLGPKKQPLRSTSYSNVSFSPSISSQAENQQSSTSCSTVASSSSLSTARPLRIYTRSCTDTEIYNRSRRGPPTAGQLGLPRPASKP